MINKIVTVFGTTLLVSLLGSTAHCADKKSFSGLADYYADMYHGKKTASGALHDKNKFMAAHRTLPFGTKVRIVNHATKKSCVVVINDRGPFTKNKVIDLSWAAAKAIGLLNSKTKMVDCAVIDQLEEN